MLKINDFKTAFPHLTQQKSKVIIPEQIKTAELANHQRYLFHKSQYKYLLQTSQTIKLEYRAFNLTIFRGQFVLYRYYDDQYSHQLLHHLEDWNQVVLQKIQSFDAEMNDGVVISQKPETAKWDEILQVLKLQTFFTNLYNLLKMTTKLPINKIKAQIVKIYSHFEGWFTQKGRKQQNLYQNLKSDVNHNNQTLLDEKNLSLLNESNFIKGKHQERRQRKSYLRTCSKIDQKPIHKNNLSPSRQRIRSLCTKSLEKFKETVQSVKCQIEEERQKFIFTINKKRSLDRSRAISFTALRSQQKNVQNNSSLHRKDSFLRDNIKQIRLTSINSQQNMKYNNYNQSENLHTYSRPSLQIDDISGKNLFNEEMILASKSNRNRNQNKINIPRSLKGDLNIPEKTTYMLKLKSIDNKKMTKDIIRDIR